jgi:hypothetical protein
MNVEFLVKYAPLTFREPQIGLQLFSATKGRVLRDPKAVFSATKLDPYLRPSRL